MNQELVAKVAESPNRVAGKLEEFPDRIAKPLRKDAECAIRAVGTYLLAELEGFESACEMRAKIKKECGLS